MATIQDIAKRAGVACGTVSNYINGTRPVSLNKQKAIIEAMESLNYEINASAKSLRQKKTNDIGFILPCLTDPYYASILSGVERYVADNGYVLSVASSKSDPNIETKCIKEMLRKQVSGLILITCQPENHELFKAKLLSKKLPVVFLDRKPPSLVTNFYSSDFYLPVKRLVKQFIKMNCRHIAFLGDKENYSDQQSAFSGYLDALIEAGIKQENQLVCRNVTDQNSAFIQFLDLLNHHHVDAVFTTSEAFAGGVRRALQVSGLSGAKDSILIGTLGQDSWSLQPHDGIYRTRRRGIMLGREAAELLCKQIAAPLMTEPVTRIIADGDDLWNGSAKVEHSSVPQTLHVVMLKTLASESLLKLLPAYERQTGNNVEVELVQHSDYYSYTRKQLLSANAADVIMMDQTTTQVLANDHLIEDITKLIERSQMDTSIFIHDCMERLCMSDKKIYGLPLVYTPQVLFYRKDLFNDRAIQNAFQRKTDVRLRPPRTWTEFNTIAEFFTQKYNEKSPIKYGTSVACKHHECLSSEVRIRMESYGGKIYNNRNKVCFQSTENMNAFFHLTDVLKCCPPDYMQKDRAGIEMDFLSGSCAMIVTFQSILNKAIENKMVNQIGVAQLPGFCSILGGWCLCLSKQSTKKEEAFRFMRWACGMDTALERAILSGQSVVTSILNNDELYRDNLWLSSWQRSYDNSFYVLPAGTPEKGLIPVSLQDEILFQVFHRITVEKETIENALEWGHQAFSRLFESFHYAQN